MTGSGVAFANSQTVVAVRPSPSLLAGPAGKKLCIHAFIAQTTVRDRFGVYTDTEMVKRHRAVLFILAASAHRANDF